jgi:glycosyltransferase involved in cell wall biosynthesis
MSTLPTLSVITPSFNQASYLEQTIQSVLSQGIPGLEYLIIDGASTDGSRDIIQRYESRLMGWVSEADQGQAEAINKGLGRVTGEVVAWLNSDDMYLPGALQAVLEVMGEHPEWGLVYGDVLAVDEKGESVNMLRYGNWGLEGLMRFQIIGQPAVFLRREVLEKGGFIDPNFHYMLDHQLWLRLAQFTQMHYIPTALAAARYHAEAKNIAQAEGFGSEALKVAAWMAEQPSLASSYHKNRGRIWAGAYCINGRYLSEAGKPGMALRSYGRSFFHHPAAVIKDWRRVLFTITSLPGLSALQSIGLRLQQRRRTARIAENEAAGYTDVQGSDGGSNA